MEAEAQTARGELYPKSRELVQQLCLGPVW